MKTQITLFIKYSINLQFIGSSIIIHIYIFIYRLMELFDLERTFNSQLLFNKISSLERWLYRADGLGLMSVIDNLFIEQGYAVNLTQEEIIKFEEGLYFLRLTDMKESYIRRRLMDKLPDGIENIKLVKDSDNQYMYVNKLNTNYRDLSEMLVELIKRGCEANPDKGYVVYDDVMTNPKIGLSKLKPYIKKLLEHYFVKNGEELEDFNKFTKYSTILTGIGEKSEEEFKEYFEDMGFEVLYQGGNGDFIDMIFGCDLIIHREDYGYKSVQIKHNFPSWDNLKYYEVDWVGIRKPNMKTYELKTRREFNIDILSEKLKMKNYWLDIYNKNL